MPKIEIREVDLTSPGNTNVTTNAAYIPGYAVTGPINTPTLCESLSDFQSIFGTSPYVFKQEQPWPANFNPVATQGLGAFYEVGDFEKSYIYAVELLRQGLPVLYERVFNPDNVSEWTARGALQVWDKDGEGSGGIMVTAVTLAATYPGSVGEDITYSLIGTKASDSQYYELSVGRKANASRGTMEVSSVVTRFTFDADLARDYSSIIYYADLRGKTDNSGLVTFSFDEEVINNIVINGQQPLAEIEKDTTLNFAEQPEGDEFSVQEMYDYLSKSGQDATTGLDLGYDRFLDKGEYVIKFLTSGAYPVFEYDSNTIAGLMIQNAGNRGDVTALIDHTPRNDRPLTTSASVYDSIKTYAQTSIKSTLGEDCFTYTAMFTPYAVFNCNSVSQQLELPGSFAYLISLAASVQANNNWLAVAGVTRGLVPNLVRLSQNLTNSVADSYQGRDTISINPITNIKPYGYTIWGNRTLKNNALKGDLTATSFLNVRQLANDVKRTLFVAAKRLTFEQNSDILWINFKSEIIPTLDNMVSGNGLTGYKITKQATTKKATVKAKITLYVVEAVEDWELTVELADSETTVSE